MKEKYGYLTVIERVPPPKHLKDKTSIYILCECDCGNQTVTRKTSLERGSTVSCGCYRKKSQSEQAKKQKTHGLSKTKFYSIWRNMKKRCHYEKYHEFHLYGGRGISVCERWHTFQNFMDDMYEDYVAFENENGIGTATIDRINSNGNYEPSNCQWRTIQQQQRNRARNISVEVNGIKYTTIKELSEVYNLHYHTVLQRYNAGKRDNELIKPTK